MDLTTSLKGVYYLLVKKVIQLKDWIIYRTRAIITQGLYISNPLFEGQKRLFKGLFLRILVLHMVSMYSRAVSNQEQVMMERVQ